MAFKISAPKISVPKISAPKISIPKISAPKITADPSKLISKAADGVVKANNDLIIKPTVGATTSVLGGVGQIMSNPAAAPVLGAVGTAFGGPAGGLIASNFSQGFSAPQGASAPVSAIAPQVFEVPASGPSFALGDNKNLFIAAVVGICLVFVLVLSMKFKKR